MKIRKYLYSLIGTLFVCCSLYGCGKTNEEKKSVSINWINYFNYNEIEQMTDVQLLHAKQKVIGTKGKELFLSDCFI